MSFLNKQLLFNHYILIITIFILLLSLFLDTISGYRVLIPDLKSYTLYWFLIANVSIISAVLFFLGYIENTFFMDVNIEILWMLCLF